MYTEYDLENLNYLKSLKKIEPKQAVDIDYLAAMYCGQNIFSIFFQNE